MLRRFQYRVKGVLSEMGGSILMLILLLLLIFRVQALHLLRVETCLVPVIYVLLQARGRLLWRLIFPRVPGSIMLTHKMQILKENYPSIGVNCLA